MLQFSTSTGRDEWLAALLGAFDAASKRSTPVTPEMLVETERHLRANARANIVGSRHIH